MSIASSLQVTDTVLVLRQELKDWENDFSASNNGQKPNREDIKNQPTIAAKYKEYNKLTDASKAKQPKSSSEPKVKLATRRYTLNDLPEESAVTPKHSRKLPPRNSLMATPSKFLHPADRDPYDSPISSRKVHTVGPTPQRDGLILGLFDLLPDENISQTPSKHKLGVSSALELNLLFTPKKQKGGSPLESRLRGSRTPTSSGKRFLLDTFVTPVKRRKTDNSHGDSPSISKLEFPTPLFLRRDRPRPFEDINSANSNIISPSTARMPPKPPIRGLSNMLADLRKMEDDILDDEMNILREIENGETIQVTDTSIRPDVSGEGGHHLPDEVNFSAIIGSEDGESDEEEARQNIGRDGQPLRVWKKRGQKRTTKRVIMRPQKLKAQPVTQAKDHVPQVAGFAPASDAENEEPIENKAASDDEDFDTAAKDSKKKGKKGKAKASKEKAPRAPRKIKATAHANYRTLKLRHKNGKGGGKFGRRR
ncbi:MAG: DNA replication regulator sld2 [Trizodia sp. TS-e1964]|nr:MAG: DNA replication regulator sld2 [Trizodia sp. TS-e1964]